MLAENDLEGWKTLNNEGAFQVSGSVLDCSGSDALMVYEGAKGNARYKNFELAAEVMTQQGANAEILFHADPDNESVPQSGYTVQLRNTYRGMDGYPSINMTGSLNRIRNVCYPLSEDGKWFDLRLKVQENHIQVYIDGEKTVDYVEPENPWRPARLSERVLSEGLLGIHCKEGNTGVKVRSLKVKALPDTAQFPLHFDKTWNRKVTRLHAKNFPLIDFHVHLKGGLKLHEALDTSAQYGVNYGIAANCGLKFPITNDKQLLEYINSQKGKPVFTAMQAEGREWVDLFSPDTVAKADYVFTDAMTWTNDQGQRMRLWIPEETHVDDPQHFMEQLVSEIEGITEEPINIYVNPTFLPEKIQNRYDELWTEERIDRVVQALVENDIALEINDRYELPSKRILKAAKDAGVKFTFGTNNTGRTVGKLEYCLRMVEELNLGPEDMWLPPVKELN
ncbi:MAG: family 16 glycoside hydrolase [Bacteroidota bacterium]